MDLEPLAKLASEAGYEAICMRASQVGVQSSMDEQEAAARILADQNLAVSMVTGDFPVVYNNERGPDCLRNITPYLDLADRLGAQLIRVAVKQPEDIPHAQSAADEAAERGLSLVHQCHTLSQFETVAGIEETLGKIDRPNFGLIFEAANLEICGQDYGAATVRKLAPWIKNVYLQNQRLDPDGAITLDTWCQGPGSFDLIQIHEPGGIAFEPIFEGLHDSGYDGWVTVHQSAPDSGSPSDSARETAHYLKKFMH